MVKAAIWSGRRFECHFLERPGEHKEPMVLKENNAGAGGVEAKKGWDNWGGLSIGEIEGQ